MKITYFKSSVDFRKWLETNSATAEQLWVGFYKKSSGKPSINRPESVDQALCFGWIDGLRKTVDQTRYKIRFSPRKRSSIWSAINIKRAGELIEQGLMQAAGVKAFEARKENRSGIYSYEQRPASLDGLYEKKFRQNKAAWEFFQKLPPSYRKKVTWWVLSAKTEETRLKRLAKLIEDCAQGRRL